MRQTMVFVGLIVVLLFAGTYLFVYGSRIDPPVPVTAPPTLVATAPDGTKLWAVVTRDGTIYFFSTHAARAPSELPVPPVQ